ncbi:unnamed protein product, partial [Closterium sp. NIES-64]
MLSISRVPTATTAPTISPSSPSRSLPSQRLSHVVVVNRSQLRNTATRSLLVHRAQLQQHQSPPVASFLDRSLLLPLRARRLPHPPSSAHGAVRQWRAVPCRASGSNGDGREERKEYSQEARMRQEVLNPFRTVRMFLYGAFIASASIGALITATSLLAIATGARDADALQIQDSLKDLGIDVAAVAIFAFLYRSDARGKDASLNRLTREESLAKLRLELPTGRIVSLAQLQGSCRLIIVAGPLSHVQTALTAAEPYRAALLERAVVVAPLVTVGAEAGAAAAENVVLPGDFKGFAEVVDAAWGGEVAGDGSGAGKVGEYPLATMEAAHAVDAHLMKDQRPDVEAGPSSDLLYPGITRSENEMRWGFIRKVYGIIGAQLLLTAAVGSCFALIPTVRDFGLTNGYFMFFATILPFATLIPLVIYRSRHPLNLALLAIWTASMSMTVGLICSMYSGPIVAEALGLTASVVLGLTAYTYYAVKKGQEFSYLGPMLYVSLWLLLGWSFIQIFWGLGSEFALALVGALIFALFIVYDTDLIIRRYSYDEYVMASLNIYLDIINLFIRMLEILQYLQAIPLVSRPPIYLFLPSRPASFSSPPAPLRAPHSRRAESSFDEVFLANYIAALHPPLRPPAQVLLFPCPHPFPTPPISLVRVLLASPSLAPDQRASLGLWFGPPYLMVWQVPRGCLGLAQLPREERSTRKEARRSREEVGGERGAALVGGLGEVRGKVRVLGEQRVRRYGKQGRQGRAEGTAGGEEDGDERGEKGKAGDQSAAPSNCRVETHSPHKPLAFSQRLDIASAIAEALCHLHTVAQPPLVHRRLCSSSVFLEVLPVARLANLGIIKGLPSSPCLLQQCHVAAPHRDPDWWERMWPTTRTDIYRRLKSLGIIMLELLSGCPATTTDHATTSTTVSLDVHQVGGPFLTPGSHSKMLASIATDDLAAVLDPSISAQSMPFRPIRSFARLASHPCAAPAARSRPDISTVVSELQGISRAMIRLSMARTTAHNSF